MDALRVPYQLKRSVQRRRTLGRRMTGIGPNGYMAFFVDAEGNRMARLSNT